MEWNACLSSQRMRYRIHSCAIPSDPDVDNDQKNKNCSNRRLFSKPGLAGLNNVRFQPYRIFKSKCYSDDKRISCTDCHDPHESVKVDATFYDTKCLACHQGKMASISLPGATAPGCRVGVKDCASCHMPRVDLPGAHFKFTDHRIRIAKEGSPYPY
jgi:hypothetical protein